MSIMVVGEGLDLSGGVLHLRLGRMLTISEREVEGQVLPLPHGGCQLYLPKSRAGRR